MEFTTEGSIHQIDFIDLRSENPEKDAQDFLIYGLFRRSADAPEQFQQFFSLFKNSLTSFEVPNKVSLVSIYIVSKTFFVGTDSKGNLHKYKYQQGDSSLTELSSLPEEQGVDFGRMGKITYLDNFVLIVAPSQSQDAEKMLNAFVYDANTGEAKPVDNKLPSESFQDLELLQSINLTINPDGKLMIFDLLLNSAVKTTL